MGGIISSIVRIYRVSLQFCSLLILNFKDSKILHPPIVAKSDKPVRFGLLGAARIAPIAIIRPALNHPEAVITAVAARDKTKAEKFAKQYAISKVYSGPKGYQGIYPIRYKA